MEEKTFFQDKGVKVTNARFVVDGQTFVMSNVTSVKPVIFQPTGWFVVVFLIIGLGALFLTPFLGVPILAIAVFGMFRKTHYHVVLTTSGGETTALTTTDQNYFAKVLAALNNAIVNRG